jgi:rhodanese-related sulfurtransferase
MHVHELNPTKTVITMVIFVVIIVVGLVTLSKPRLTYILTPQQTVALAIGNEGFVSPNELYTIQDQSNSKVILIDIRNSYDFARGHLPGAENISAVKLISEDNISRLQAFKDAGQSVLLYGNTLDEANGPFMVLRQIGFDNVMVLMHGFEYYQQKIDNLLEIEDMAFVLPEKAAYDYALVIKSPSNFVDKDDASSSQNISTTRSKTTQNKEH